MSHYTKISEKISQKKNVRNHVRKHVCMTSQLLWQASLNQPLDVENEETLHQH